MHRAVLVGEPPPNHKGNRNSIHMEGKGVVAGLRRDLEQAWQRVRHVEAVAEQLEADKGQLSRQLDSSYDELKSLMVEAGALQDTMELDRAMQSRDGPIRLSGRMVGTMWQHLNFTVLKRERDRHLEEARRLNEDLAMQKMQLEMHMRLLKMELRKLEKEHTSALEAIDCLCVNHKSVKLCREEKAVIQKAWKEATGPRPWAGDLRSAETNSAQSPPTFGNTGGGQASAEAETPWSFASWLEPLDIPSLVADAFERMITDKGCPESLHDQEGKKAFLYALANNATSETIREMLRATPLLDALTERIGDALSEFKTQCDELAEGKARTSEIAAAAIVAAAAATVPNEIDFEDPETFAKEAASRLLVFGPRPLYYSSLRDFIGSPASDGLAAMGREHTVQADSDLDFVAPNHDIRTTSKVEWYIVTDPDKAKMELDLHVWPMGGGHTPIELGCRHIHSPTGEHFASRIADVNGRLRMAGDKEPLTLEHFCALRMYTGPIYVKYNFILRGAHSALSNDFISRYVERYCCNNKYPTTLLYLCLGITKLSRITKAQKVYRVPGGRMPKEFFEEKSGARGGIELGFMSTTTQKKEAMKYAAYSGCALIFEVQQGMVSKGADIGWLSQFPSETEVLFAPLTVFEVHQIRCEGAFQVVELRPSTSSAAKWSEMELFSDERLGGILTMLRRDTNCLARIDAAVRSRGGLPADAPQPEAQLHRAQAYRTRASLVTIACEELVDSCFLDSMHADEQAQIADITNSTDIEPRAVANAAKAKLNTAKMETQRHQDTERKAAEDGISLEQLLKPQKEEPSSEERFERVEKAKARWQPTIKEAQSGGNVMALMARARKQQRENQARMGFP